MISSNLMTTLEKMFEIKKNLNKYKTNDEANIFVFMKLCFFNQTSYKTNS